MPWLNSGGEMVYIRFERGRDGIIGPTYGPYDFVQGTYTLIRAGRTVNGDYEETELATYDRQDEDWVLVDKEAEEVVFSDYIVYSDEG